MPAIKIKLPIAVENAIGFTLDDGTTLSYVQAREHRGADQAPQIFGAVLFDSYATWPIDAPEKIKVVDAFLGPGYWLTGPAKAGDTPPKTGRRLLVVADVNIRQISWSDDSGESEVAIEDTPKSRAFVVKMPAKTRATIGDADKDEAPRKSHKLAKAMPSEGPMGMNRG